MKRAASEQRNTAAPATSPGSPQRCIGVRASSEYLFFVIVLPSGSYFPQVPSGSTGTVRVFVSETVGRSAAGGTGDAKAGQQANAQARRLAEVMTVAPGNGEDISARA